MNKVFTIFKRELSSYFATPVAYVFLIVFLALSGALTFYMGNFFERGNADLQPFFMFHPWLYLFLIPAVTMRLWSEERKTGTVELLLTLPITPLQAVMGKFLAAWCFTTLALVLTFPIWITVNFLGSPDNGAVLTGYIGSILMAGAFIAIGSAISSMSKNQVIAFVVAASVCFFFTATGTPMVLNILTGWAPEILRETIASLSFITHFNDIARGVIALQSLVFFISLMGLFLYINMLTLEWKKAD